ncbi:MAG TPA: hypothetical protein VH683_01375 [Thermoleophilaceae bacterium]|jgi:hypothetical protein
MALRFAIRFSILVVIAALPASAHAASAVVPSTVSAHTVVPAGGARTVTLTCPRLAVALNAAVTRKGAGVTVQRSRPGRSADDWSFRLVAARGGGSRSANMVLRCVRLHIAKGLSGARLVVNTAHQTVSIPARGSVPAPVSCSRGFVGTGYALAGGPRGLIRLATVEPTSRGWNFVVENTGAARANATVYGRCLKRNVAARGDGGSVSLRFGVTLRSRRNTVGPGSARTVVHRCRPSEVSLATGSIVDALDSIELAGSAPAGPRAGRWTFTNASRGDRADTSLVCLSRRGAFR